MSEKKSPLGNLPPSKRVLLLKDFFTSGGTPPAHEQSARADAMAFLLGKKDLSTRAIARFFKRRLQND
ncbi:MAG TPA: hypothetical protein GXX69_02890 [Firmicutes bacterium]|jgi:hypothetical protein|nr:hypothetical protein [Bacillota bacterium]